MAKPKRATTVEFIPRETDDGAVREPYEICDRIVATDRADLVQAKIGFAWRIGWKKDKWGQLKIGQCKKRNDLDRALDRWDFVILLNKEAWPHFTPEQKERLIFHELCHAAVETDDNGDEKRDEAGRLVIAGRRRHDIEDFRAVVEKYGWKEDLQDLAQRNYLDADRPLLHTPTNDERPETSDDGDEPEWQTVETVKCKGVGVNKTFCEVTIQRKGGQWRSAYALQLGNYADGVTLAQLDGGDRWPTLEQCWRATYHEAERALDAMQFRGTPAQQQDLDRRRKKFREQLVTWFDERIAAAKNQK